MIFVKKKKKKGVMKESISYLTMMHVFVGTVKVSKVLKKKKTHFQQGIEIILKFRPTPLVPLFRVWGHHT